MRNYDWALTTLMVVGLLLPYLTFVAHNRFRSFWLTAMRGLLAVGAGWMFWWAYAFATDAVIRAEATTPDEIEAANNGDGAKLAFALLFGWFVPAVTVAGTWVVRSWIASRLRRIGSNNSLNGDVAKATRR